MQTLDADQYAGYLTMQGLAEHTIRAYRPMMLRWVDYATCADKNPYRPDPLTVRAWTRQLPGSRSTLAHARACMSHLCRALEVEDVSDAIPLPRHPRPHPQGMEPLQAEQLVKVAARSGLSGLAVLVGLYTAARRSEIASLSWRRIDFDAGTVTLDRPKTRDLHTVPLHPALGRHLDERRVPGSTWVFPGPWGGHVTPTTVWQWVVDVSTKAGVRVTPHRLRHHCLTTANDVTGDLRAVQDLAGHTDPAVTARYTRTSRDALTRAVMALDYGEAA